MSLGTSNRDGGKTSESGHLRSVSKTVSGDVLNGLNLSQRAAGANMSVDIAAGDAFVRRSDGSYAHPVFNDAVYNLVISAADGANPRRDIVVIYVDYAVTPSTAVSNNTNGVVKIKVVNGTPAGSPVDPSSATIQASVGAGNPYSILARVRVPAGQTSISNSLIDDLRTMITSNATVALSKIKGGSTAGVLKTDASGNVTVGAKTTDANGWTVYDYGAWKEYTKKFTGQQTTNVGADGNVVIFTSEALPAGMTSLTGKHMQAHITYRYGGPWAFTTEALGSVKPDESTTLRGLVNNTSTTPALFGYWAVYVSIKE